MAINIVKQSRELTKVEKYKMTKDAGIMVMKNIEDNTLITVDAYCIFEDVKKDGSKVELLSILSADGYVYTCQSKTFTESFMDIANIFDGEEFSIVKFSGETKAGRPYVNCRLAV